MPGLLGRAQLLERLPYGVRLSFDPAPGVLLDIAGVVERERNCCGFLRFDISIPPAGERFTLVMTGPEGTAEFIETAMTMGAVSLRAADDHAPPNA